jgi:hypothetical protein
MGRDVDMMCRIASQPRLWPSLHVEGSAQLEILDVLHVCCCLRGRIQNCSVLNIPVSLLASYWPLAQDAHGMLYMIP